MRIVRQLKDNMVVFSAMLIIFLVICNAGLIMYNNAISENMAEIKTQTEEAKKLNGLIWDDIIRNFDIGLRGFALTKDEGLLMPFTDAVAHYPNYFNRLDSVLKLQSYSDINELASLREAYNNYVVICGEMVELVRKDSMNLFTQEMKKDRGRDIWKFYEQYTKKLYAFEDELYLNALTEYRTANTRTGYLQVALVLIVIPTLLLMIVRIRRDAKLRRQLFKELDYNNRKYLFDPGDEGVPTNERDVLNHSILNFQQAVHFIKQVSGGNYQVEWELLTEKNQALNQTNLAGELVAMRQKMECLKQEDERRQWSTEGLANFSETLRSHQHHLQELCNQVIGFVVKYLKAQQGSLFLLQEENGEPYLELMGCYAFNRKKYVDKKIAPGQGLVGQTYREGQTILLTDVPQGYTTITSGLGDVTPSCLLLVPLQHNGQVEAIIELAAFEKFEPYQVEWLEKVGEITAATLISVKTSEKTQQLLEQFRLQTEQLRAQEEELRQNMEEMEATQEEMRRKEKEMEHKHSKLQ